MKLIDFLLRLVQISQQILLKAASVRLVWNLNIQTPKIRKSNRADSRRNMITELKKCLSFALQEQLLPSHTLIFKS